MCYCQFLLLCLLVFVLCMEVFLHWVHAAAAKSLQSCPTLCDPRDGSPPGSPIPGILQARTLEWVAISFSNAWKWKVKVKSLSCVWLLATPWTVARQAPPSLGFSRQEYWSGAPLLPQMTPLALVKMILYLWELFQVLLLWDFKKQNFQNQDRPAQICRHDSAFFFLSLSQEDVILLFTVN